VMGCCGTEEVEVEDEKETGEAAAVTRAPELGDTIDADSVELGAAVTTNGRTGVTTAAVAVAAARAAADAAAEGVVGCEDADSDAGGLCDVRVDSRTAELGVSAAPALLGVDRPGLTATPEGDSECDAALFGATSSSSSSSSSSSCCSSSSCSCARSARCACLSLCCCFSLASSSIAAVMASSNERIPLPLPFSSSITVGLAKGLSNSFAATLMLPVREPGAWSALTDEDMLTLTLMLRELTECSKGAIGENDNTSSLKNTLLPRRRGAREDTEAAPAEEEEAEAGVAAVAGTPPADAAAAVPGPPAPGGGGDVEGDDAVEERICRLADIGDNIGGEDRYSVDSPATDADDAEAPTVPGAATGRMGLSGMTCSPGTTGVRSEERRLAAPVPV